MSSTDGIDWHVVQNGQRLTTYPNAASNGFDDVWEVTYMVDSGPARGTTGYVRIPVAQYNGATVQAAIAEQVKKLHEVGSL